VGDSFFMLLNLCCNCVSLFLNLNFERPYFLNLNGRYSVFCIMDKECTGGYKL
jgi:hypothetical protein